MTAKIRADPVTGKPDSTSSIAEMSVREGSSATMPPATMKAKSDGEIGRIE